MARPSATGASHRKASAQRWLACLLLAAFTLAQGVSLTHAAGPFNDATNDATGAHDHDGACAACRLVDDHSNGLATTTDPGDLNERVAVFVAADPEIVLEQAAAGLHPARAPPIA